MTARDTCLSLKKRFDISVYEKEKEENEELRA